MLMAIFVCSIGSGYAQDDHLASTNANPGVTYQNLSDKELKDFNALATTTNRLGRVTKHNYNYAGKLISETAFEFNLYGHQEFGWKFTYFYNDRDSLIRITQYNNGDDQLIEIPFGDERRKTLKTYNDQKQLLKQLFTQGDYTYEERFAYDKKGRIAEKTTLSNGALDAVTRYVYNAKNLPVKELKYVDKTLDYTYESTFDDKGRRVRYDMIDHFGIVTGVWLYQYNEKNQLVYKIDLYGQPAEKKLSLTETIAPPPPLKPNNEND